MLKRPITLKADGKNLAMNVVKTIAKKDSVTYFLRSQDGSIEVKAIAEYDGVVWFTVTLLEGRVKPKYLSLELPLDKKYVDAFDDNSSCFEKTSLVNKAVYKFNVDPVANPFFWCGGNDVGISGGTHTHRGRYIKDKRKSMNVTGNKNEVLI